jgi:hypothetical protein
MVVHTSVMPALGRLREEDCEFKASLGCIESLRLAWAAKQDCLKNTEERAGAVAQVIRATA